MFKPFYKLTNALLKNLNEIERLYGKLQGMQIPKNLFLNLERNNLIQSSFSSNSIEGNPLSHAEVTNLLLDDRVATNRDEKEVSNYFNILKKLTKQINLDFDVNLILQIHNELLSSVDDKIKGNIRDKSVIVGRYGLNQELIIKYEPPTHKKEEIRKLIDELTSWTSQTNEQPILKAGIYHHQFVYIHPFEDGNGRVCRLTTALLLLKNQYSINKYFVLDDYYDLDRETYSNKLLSADSGDKTEWLIYFTEGFKYSLQSSLSKIKTGLDKLKIDMRPTPKEKEALEIIKQREELTSNDLATELKISRQQAFNLLNGLSGKGYIEKIGITKNSYYRLI